MRTLDKDMPGQYVPKAVRGRRAAATVVKYCIASLPGRRNREQYPDVNMKFGPYDTLGEALETVGAADHCIVEITGSKVTDRLLYRWDEDREMWVKEVWVWKGSGYKRQV